MLHSVCVSMLFNGGGCKQTVDSLMVSWLIDYWFFIISSDTEETIKVDHVRRVSLCDRLFQ